MRHENKSFGQMNIDFVNIIKISIIECDYVLLFSIHQDSQKVENIQILDENDN